jgi:hypothetical protein
VTLARGAECSHLRRHGLYPHAAMTLTAIEAEILRLVAARGPAASISPTDVAQAVAPGETQWRSQLGAVRRAAVGLARAGRIDILRKGKPVDPAAEPRGVIRLRARPEPPSGEPS